MKHEVFRYCESLESIEIPGTLESVDGNNFSDCDSLKKIIVNEGVKKIDRFAFNPCPALESVKLPSTIEYIDPAAFCDSEPQHVKELESLSEVYPVKNGKIRSKSNKVMLALE